MSNMGLYALPGTDNGSGDVMIVTTILVAVDEDTVDFLE